MALSACEYYPYEGLKLQPPHGAWVIEANPAIILASYATANLYFSIFLHEYNFTVEYF